MKRIFSNTVICLLVLTFVFISRGKYYAESYDADFISKNFDSLIEDIVEEGELDSEGTFYVLKNNRTVNSFQTITTFECTSVKDTIFCRALIIDAYSSMKTVSRVNMVIKKTGSAEGYSEEVFVQMSLGNPYYLISKEYNIFDEYDYADLFFETSAKVNKSNYSDTVQYPFRIVLSNAGNLTDKDKQSISGLSNDIFHTAIILWDQFLEYYLDYDGLCNFGFADLCPGHSYNITTEPATCTHDGYQKNICRYCGLTTVQSFPASHTVVVDTAVPATCTTSGKTAGSHCSVCNTVINAQTIVPASHTVIVDPAVPATCTTAGKTKGTHCSVCNKVISAQTSVAAKGHTVVTDPAVPVTCTTAGKTKGTHCSVCNKVISAQSSVAAKGHTVVTDPAVPATCTTAGKTKGTHCSVCNTVISAQTSVAAKGHTIVTDPAVPATCIAPGKTKGTHCSVCKAIITVQKDVPANANGHTWTSWKTLDKADVVDPCYQERYCTICGEAQERFFGNKLTPTIKLSKTKISLKNGKNYLLKISKLARADYVASVKSNKKSVVTVKMVKMNQYRIVASKKKKGTAKITVTLGSGLKRVVKVTVK